MKEGGPTTQELRDIHKSISKRMKILDKYYRERLDRDADLNATYMQYLSFCEVALSICDRYYRSVVKQDVKGDTAYMKGGYTRLGFHIKATDSNGKETETNIPPGIYEGYLMAGRTPVQAVKEYKEYMELLELGEGHRNGAQESKFRFLDKIHTLAADFASANRYIMWKDVGSYTKNDLNYAFFQLPAMETRHERNESLEGDLVDKYSASCTYQGVIFENIFEGMKDVDDIAGPAKKRSERIWGLDNYLSRKVQEKPDLMHKIVNCFCENKPDEVSFGIAEYVIESIMRSYVIHVLADLELRKNDISIIETELKAHSAIKTHLTQIAADIRNEEL